MIGRGQLAKAAAWQLLFVARGADRALRRLAEERGWPALAFTQLAYPATARNLSPALLGVPLALSFGLAFWAARRAT